MKLFQRMKQNYSRSLTHVNNHVRTQWLFYMHEVSPHFHHYHIQAWSPSRQFSLPWWQASNVDSPSCPSHSPITLQHTQHLYSHKHKSSRPITDRHTALSVFPRAIHRAVNLANCANTWPHRSCVYTEWYFSHTPLGFTSPYYLHVPLIPHYPKIRDF